MDNRYYQPWDRHNFEFRRTDPKPWIPFEDDYKRRINWKSVAYWVLCFVMIVCLPALVRWYPL